MTAAGRTPDRPPAGPAPAPAPADAGVPNPHGLPAARRGATVVPDTVVARIAGKAAGEAVERHCAPSGRPGRRPRATASVHKGTARLGITTDLPYPADIARIGEAVRRDVRDRVAHLTGLAVDDVGLTVRHLVVDEDRRRVD